MNPLLARLRYHVTGAIERGEGVPVVNISANRAMYLDWVNNFLTVAKFAEHYRISIPNANRVIKEGREEHEAAIANP